MITPMLRAWHWRTYQPDADTYNRIYRLPKASTGNMGVAACWSLRSTPLRQHNNERPSPDTKVVITKANNNLSNGDYTRASPSMPR